MRNGTFKGYACQPASQPAFRLYHKSMSSALSVRSTDRKYVSRDFHKASEFDFSSTDSLEYVVRGNARTQGTYAPRSFNTVLMIYVSGYILHRILSRINVDTGNEAFSRTLQGRDFYVPCKGSFRSNDF